MPPNAPSLTCTDQVARVSPTGPKGARLAADDGHKMQRTSDEKVAAGLSEFSANRHDVIVSCGRGFGVHTSKVESGRQPVGRRAGGVWPTRLGADAGRASPFPARRRLSDTAYPQLLLRPGQRHAAQPRHPGRRRLGRAADGLVLRHRAAGRRRLHLAAAVGAAEPLGDVQRHEHAAARRLRLLCPRPSLCLGALAGPDLHRLSPVHRRARGQSLGQPHGAADLRGLCAAREARRRKIFCRLRGGHEAARLLGLHQHGRSRRRARRQCRHGAGQPQIRRPDQGRARCTGIGLYRAGHPVVELLRRHGRDPASPRTSRSGCPVSSWSREAPAQIC